MNYGFDLAREVNQQSRKDWRFGSESRPCLAEIPSSERLQYLPIGESQRGKEDMMDCASRGPLNILEMKLTYLLQNGLLSLKQQKFLIEYGYVQNDRVRVSDAFVAILSGTTRRGNSMKAPLEAIRRFGLIPNRLLPYDPSMTWSQYHDWNRITPNLRSLGREFAQLFPIYYERIVKNQFSDLLNREPINVAGYAWPVPDDNGVYGYTSNKPNHVFVLHNLPPWQAYDNYRDNDGDFQKTLDESYRFLNYGYRVYITEEHLPRPLSLWSRLLDLVRLFVTRISRFGRL